MTEHFLTHSVQRAAQAVFDELGSGHSEAVYEAAMSIELNLAGFGVIARQVPCPISYKGYNVGIGLMDIVISNHYVVELKAVTKLTSRDEQQVRKYLLGSGLDYGMLINFGLTLEAVEISLNNQKEIIHEQTPSTSD